MNLGKSVSDIEKFTVKKIAVVFKCEAGKDVKTDTNTQMKQYPIQYLRWIWDVTYIYKNSTPEPEMEKDNFFTQARFELKLFYPKKCVNWGKSEFATKQH